VKLKITVRVKLKSLVKRWAALRWLGLRCESHIQYVH
jgi:hypothetical protein